MGVGGNWRKVVNGYKLPAKRRVSPGDVTYDKVTTANTVVWYIGESLRESNPENSHHKENFFLLCSFFLFTVSV